MTEAEELRAADWWKNARAERPTRAQLQAKIDRQYACGVIDRAEWIRGTDHLSTCDAAGWSLPLNMRRKSE